MWRIKYEFAAMFGTSSGISYFASQIYVNFFFNLITLFYVGIVQ